MITWWRISWSCAISFPELRSPWPALGKREIWEQPFQACAIACRRCRLRLRSAKRMLPELSFSNRWSRGTKLWKQDWIVWWVNLLPSWKLLHSLFATLSIALSSKIWFKVYYREEFEHCKIHSMDKVCLQLGTFEKFATAVLQTSANRCLPWRYHFFESAAEANSAWNSSKKTHSGINWKIKFILQRS